MARGEERRHQLYQRLESVLGPDEATTLMEHLPPVGWADVATKHDLEQLRAATKQDLEQLRGAMDVRFVAMESHVDARLHAELNRLLYWFLPFAAALISTLIATR